MDEEFTEDEVYSAAELLAELRQDIACSSKFAAIDKYLRDDAEDFKFDNCVFEDVVQVQPSNEVVEDADNILNAAASPIKRKRGRPKKEHVDEDQMFQDILFKAYDVGCNKRGDLTFSRNGVPLTLEETAYLLWCFEGKKTSKPMTKVGILKIEKQALDKCKKAFAKHGIKNLDDVFECSGRQRANAVGVMQSDY